MFVLTQELIKKFELYLGSPTSLQNICIGYLAWKLSCLPALLPLKDGIILHFLHSTICNSPHYTAQKLPFYKNGRGGINQFIMPCVPQLKIRGSMNSVLPCLPFLNLCCLNGEPCLALTSQTWNFGFKTLKCQHLDLVHHATLLHLHPYVHQPIKYMQVLYNF